MERSALTITNARNGSPTIRLNERFIHSRFDPEREAERFVNTIDTSDPRLVLVIAPGLGYVVRPLRHRFPNARLIGLFCSSETSSSAVARFDESWNPDDEEPLPRFLERVIPEVLVGTLTATEWPPAAEAWQMQTRAIRQAVQEVTGRAQASLFSTGGMGKLRFHNWVKNRDRIRAHRTEQDTERRISAVAVVAAGPSLEQSVSALRQVRDAVLIWTTGSALEALADAGIRPDAIIVTEPSVYAALHLRSVLSRVRRNADDPPLVVPTTVNNSICEAERVVFFSEGDISDRIFRAATPTLPYVPSRGTVTFSAVTFARQLGEWPILLAGADFAFLDQRSHARPHLAARYQLNMGRTPRPAETAVFDRTQGHHQLTDGWTTDRTLTTYANWLASSGRSEFSPIFRLAGSPVPTGIPEIEIGDVHNLPRRFSAVRFAVNGLAPRKGSCRNIVDTLIQQASVRSDRPTPMETMPDDPFIDLAKSLAIQPLLHFARSGGGRTEWSDVCRSVQEELEEVRRWL